MSTNIEHMTWGTEMPHYELYYWSVPFRGQFVRAVLAYAGKTGYCRGQIEASLRKVLNV